MQSGFVLCCLVQVGWSGSREDGTSLQQYLARMRDVTHHRTGGRHGGDS